MLQRIALEIADSESVSPSIERPEFTIVADWTQAI